MQFLCGKLTKRLEARISRGLKSRIDGHINSIRTVRVVKREHLRERKGPSNAAFEEIGQFNSDLFLFAEEGKLFWKFSDLSGKYKADLRMDA